jgi:hypothetical protein
MYILYRSALKVPPCRSPCSILNSSDTWSFHLREAYTLQPTKSVIIPIKTCPKTTYDNENWYMNGKFLAKAEKAPHIGIQRDSKNSTLAAIEEKLKKSRKALYSLMGSGLRG